MALARDNQAWIRDLSSDNEAQSEALGELRRILMAGLARSLISGSRVNQAFLEDVVQDAIMRILANLSSFEGRSRFTTWAMAIATRVAMSRLRRKHWKDVSLESAAEQGQLKPQLAVDKSLSPAQQAEQGAILEVLREQIERLTPRQRMAIQAELAGMPVPEIATRLRSNANAVHKLMHDVRKRLKGGLEEAGYSVEDVQSAFG